MSKELLIDAVKKLEILVNPPENATPQTVLEERRKAAAEAVAKVKNLIS